MTILLIEDEAPAAEHLTTLLARHRPDAQVLAIVRSIGEATNWFAAATIMPDLVFSDIELLDGNVFALYDRVAVPSPIIFTTAYDQFLLKAFQTNGIAYLLKPFDDQAFAAALAKYDALRTTFQTTTPSAETTLTADVLAQLRDALAQQTAAPLRQAYKQRFTVRMRNGIYLLPTDQIAYLQADDSVVFAHDHAGQRYPLNGTLTDIEGQLDPAHFFRINRSDIITIDQIERLETYFGDRLAIRLRGITEPFISSAAKTPDLRRWLDR